jgi:hypothetical protein
VLEDDLDGLNPLVELALGGAGFVLGLVFMFAGSGGTPQSKRFVAMFGAKFWMGLIALHVAYGAVIFRPLWRLLLRYRAHFLVHWRRALAFSIVFTAALGAFYDARIPTNNPLAHHAGKILIITIVGVPLVVLPAVVGIFLIQLTAERRFLGGDPEEADIDRYLVLREDLQRLLAMLGGFVALVTLATGALRKAVIAYGVPQDRFPPEIVLLWGGAATALLLAAYVPAHLTLSSAGRRLRDAFLPRRSPRDEGYVARAVERKTFEEDLQLQVTLAQRLQTGILVLAPLTSALISLAFPAH